MTHVVLVDGLPVDCWVVWGEEAERYGALTAYGSSSASGDGWGLAGPRQRGAPDRWEDDDRGRWSDREPPTFSAPPSPPLPSRDEQRLVQLEEVVGGTDALTAIDTEPLPTERLDPETLPAELRPVLEAVVGLCDEVTDRWFDGEARTALHRLLAEVVAARPDVLADPDVALSAAALCWMVGRGNGFVGPQFGVHAVTNKDLVAHFRQPPNLVEALAGRMLPVSTAMGRRRSRSRPSSGYVLGRPEWLTSRRRAAIVRERDALLRRIAAQTRAAASGAAGIVEPPLLETASGPDGPESAAPEWELSLRLLTGP